MSRVKPDNGGRKGEDHGRNKRRGRAGKPDRKHRNGGGYAKVKRLPRKRKQPHAANRANRAYANQLVFFKSATFQTEKAGVNGFKTEKSKYHGNGGGDSAQYIFVFYIKILRAQPRRKNYVGSKRKYNVNYRFKFYFSARTPVQKYYHA